MLPLESVRLDELRCDGFPPEVRFCYTPRAPAHLLQVLFVQHGGAFQAVSHTCRVRVLYDSRVGQRKFP